MKELWNSQEQLRKVRTTFFILMVGIPASLFIGVTPTVVAVTGMVVSALGVVISKRIVDLGERN